MRQTLCFYSAVARSGENFPMKVPDEIVSGNCWDGAQLWRTSPDGTASLLLLSEGQLSGSHCGYMLLLSGCQLGRKFPDESSR